MYGLFINLTHLDIVAISNYIRCKALYWKYWHQMGLNVPAQYFPYCFKMLTSKLPEWGEEIKRFYSQTPHIMLQLWPFWQCRSYWFCLIFLIGCNLRSPRFGHMWIISSLTNKLEHCVPFRRDHWSFTLPNFTFSEPKELMLALHNV